MIIGIKYCGGCNSHFDRTSIVNQLMNYYSNHKFEYAKVGIEYDILIIVNGCPRSCAKHDLLRGKKIIVIDSDEENIDLS